jgi:hypothetical protein
MQRTLALIAVAAVPAAAAAHGLFAPRDGLCLVSGSATYRIAQNAASPDFRVRVAGETDRADLRMQLVDRAEIADFALVDDFSGGEPGACRSAAPVRTVAVDASAKSPDVVVALSADAAGADYRIFVHSLRYSQQDAAALLAAIWKANRRREVAARAVR